MRAPFPPVLKWTGLVLACISLVALVLLTPGGLLRKIDYVGAAVCHRRPSHSFSIAGRQLPLCQRCSGTFPGALTGVLTHWLIWRRRRSARFPSWPMFALMALFAGIWALDGINSTTADAHVKALVGRFVNRPPGVGLLGYSPQPWLRLFSGALMGMSMSAVLVPAFNQAVWKDGEDVATIRSWHELAFLIAVELGMGALIYILSSSQSSLALYAVSIYSALGVVTMFTLLGAMMFVLLTRRDAGLVGWREAWVPMVWGLVFAALMVAVMDSARLWMTGTIDGVPGLP
ncbi:MAG: DUF2085 domain-containing protein [Anaerolineae bacterium]